MYNATTPKNCIDGNALYIRQDIYNERQDSQVLIKKVSTLWVERETYYERQVKKVLFSILRVEQVY